MEWQLKSPSNESLISGKRFEIGDQIVCFLYKNEEGELERMDIASDEIESTELPQNILGCWTHTIKESAGQEEREMQKQTIASSEELFLSFYKQQDGETEAATEEVSEDRDTLKQILALMLERKRILKPTTDTRTGEVEYWHAKSKKNYTVDLSPIPIEKAITLQEQLQMLMGGNT